MKFSINERIGLLNILPERGTLATMRVLRDLRNELGFSEEEIAQAQIRQVDDQLMWDSSYEVEKDIEIGLAVRGVILETIEALDSQGEVTELTLDLYEQFAL